MAEPQPEKSKSFWDSLNTKIGVISGAIGLVVLAIGLPDSIMKKIGRTDSKAAAVDLAQKRAELAAAGPRLDVSYLFLASDLLYQDPALVRKRATTKQAVTILQFPTAKNEILDDVDQSMPNCRGLGKLPVTSVAFLVIENRGKRDASGISVQADRLRLGGPANIREEAGGGDDYLAKLRRVTRTKKAVTITLPETLAPGDGVRVPLWVSQAPYHSAARWCIASRVALEPKTVRFVDPVLRSSAQTPVRRLATPVILGEGIEGRG